MPSLILWILAVYGLVFLLSDAKILSEWIPVRPLLQRVKFFRELLQCYFCMGIWVGAALWFALTWPNPFNIQAAAYLPAGAAGAYLIDLLTNYVETQMMATFEEMHEGKEE